MEKFMSWKSFLKMLENNHFDNLSQHEKQVIYDVLKYREFSTEEVYAIVNGAKKKFILSSKDKKFVKLNLFRLIREQFSRLEIELYKRLDEIDQIFKDYFRQNNIKQKDYTEGLKDCWNLARRVNKTIDKELVQFTGGELETFEILAKLYRSVAEHVENEPITAYVREKDENDNEVRDEKTNRHKMVKKDFVRVADYIVSTRLAELHDVTLSKLTNETVREFDGFLKAITSVAEENARDTFSKDEVKELLDKSISLITRVSADKYEAIRDLLNTYLQTVVDQYSQTADKKDLEDFSNITAKNILLRCASVFVQTPETIGFNLDFMSGMSIQSAGERLINNSSSQTSATAKNAKLLMKFYPNLTLRDMDLKSHLFFAKHTPSHVLYLTTSSVLSTTNNLLDMILIGLGQDIKDKDIPEKKLILNKLGFNIDNIYTKDNIFEVYSHSVIKLINEKDSDTQKTIIANVKTLSQYLKPNQLYKIFAHNFNLLLVDNDKIVNKINEIKEKSLSDNKKFIKLFHKFINDNYTISEDVVLTGNKKVKSTKSKIVEEEKIEAPDKKVIIVDIIGKELEEEQQETEHEIVEEEKVDCFKSFCEELEQLSLFAKSKNSKELLDLSSEIKIKTVAEIFRNLHLNKKMTSKNTFDKALSKLKVYAQGSQLQDISSEDREYAICLIDDVIDNLSCRMESISMDIKETDDMISMIVDAEKDKKSRKNSYQIKQLVEKINELKSNNLITKKYSKLIDEDTLRSMAEEASKMSKNNEEIADYRKMLHALLEDLPVLSREIKFIKMAMETLDSCKENMLVKEKVEEIEEISSDRVESDDEILEQIQALKQQRDLKVRSIRTAYRGRIRQNDFTMEELDKIVAENPHGKRMLSAINRIDEQIAKLEAKLSKSTTID